MNRTEIPGVDEIVEEAIAKIRAEDPDALTPQAVLDHFSDAVENVFGATYDAYKRHERGRIEAHKRKFTEGLPETVPRKRVEKIVDEAVDGVIGLEKSLKQSRASRAGKSLERIVQKLLALVGIPSEAVTRGDKKYKLDRIDLVIPDRQTAINNPRQGALPLAQDFAEGALEAGDRRAAAGAEDPPDHHPAGRDAEQQRGGGDRKARDIPVPAGQGEGRPIPGRAADQEAVGSALRRGLRIH